MSLFFSQKYQNIYELGGHDTDVLSVFPESHDAVLFCVPDYSNSRVVRPELQTATSLPALIIFNAFDDTAESIFFPVLNPFFPATSKFLFIRATVGLK